MRDPASKQRVGAGGTGQADVAYEMMAQWLGAYADFVWDLSLIPITYTGLLTNAHNSSSGRSLMLSFRLQNHNQLYISTYICIVSKK